MKFYKIKDVWEQDLDFRDLLPKLNRNVFKHPLIPAVLWKELGDRFEFRRWKRILKKYRTILSIRKYTIDDSDTSGLADRSNFYIYIEINEYARIDYINDLKFEIIQTVMHEYIHIHQMQSHEDQCDWVIDEHPNEFEDYLSSFGEIQAYAHCAALEFSKSRQWGWGSVYFSYENTSLAVRKEFIRQIIKWLNKYEHYENLQTISSRKNHQKHLDTSSS